METIINGQVSARLCIAQRDIAEQPSGPKAMWSMMVVVRRRQLPHRRCKNRHTSDTSATAATMGVRVDTTGQTYPIGMDDFFTALMADAAQDQIFPSEG